MTPLQAGLGVAVGFGAGILSGLFGVGGGIVTTPAVNTILGGTAIQAIATPLPVILPTSLVGSYTYAKAGEVSFRAARWAAVPGIGGAILGALLTEIVNTNALLLVTSGLIAITAVQVIAGRSPTTPWVRGRTPGWRYGAVGLLAGFVSGLLGVAVGFGAGVLSGLFGVGGGIVTTPAVNTILGGTAIQAIATPLPVILPTSLVGSYTYAKAGEVSFRAARWAADPGVGGAIIGALLTEVVNAHLLLLVTAGLIAITAVQVIAGRTPRTQWVLGETPGWKYAAVGLVAGFVSGLLGVGGGIVMVPAFTIWIGMPLRRALGTSLLVIAILVIPGTIVHALLGNVDWAISLVLTLGVIPGARLGARIALGVRERTLRVAVGTFLLVVGIAYAAAEVTALARGRG